MVKFPWEDFCQLKDAMKKKVKSDSEHFISTCVIFRNIILEQTEFEYRQTLRIWPEEDLTLNLGYFEYLKIDLESENCKSELKQKTETKLKVKVGTPTVAKKQQKSEM